MLVIVYDITKLLLLLPLLLLLWLLLVIVGLVLVVVVLFYCQCCCIWYSGFCLCCVPVIVIAVYILYCAACRFLLLASSSSYTHLCPWGELTWSWTCGGRRDQILPCGHLGKKHSGNKMIWRYTLKDRSILYQINVFWNNVVFCCTWKENTNFPSHHWFYDRWGLKYATTVQSSGRCLFITHAGHVRATLLTGS